MKNRESLEEKPIILLKSFLLATFFNRNLRVNPGRNPCGEIGPGWCWYFEELSIDGGFLRITGEYKVGTPFKLFLHLSKGSN